MRDGWRTVKREPVASTAIRSIGYHVQEHILEVEFESGAVYRYFDVPAFLYHGFMVAASKGAYFAKRINSRFRFEEVR